MNLFKILLIICGMVFVRGELACYACDPEEKSCDNVTALYIEVNFCSVKKN